MANHIPREFIDQLLNHIDIVEVIDARVPLVKRGANYLARCPFHNEKTPSFTVHQDRQFYHCFGCKASGNAISFLMEYDGMDFLEVIETLAQQANLPIPVATAPSVEQQQISVDLYAVLNQAALFYQQQLKNHPDNTFAIDYLKRRGLTGEIAKLFRLGYAPAGWDNLLKHAGKNREQQIALSQAGLVIQKEEGGYYDRFRQRIMFPIRDRRGKIIAFGGRVLDASTPKYLNSPETAIFHKGQELYGLFEARQVNRKLARVIIVEGYMDVIALFQHGITYAVATLGTATSSTHLQKLFRLTAEVIFCFDGDNAGKEAAKRALEVTLPVIADNKVARFLFLPESEDPDSLIREEGSAAFSKRIDTAMPLTEFFFTLLTEQVANPKSLEGRAHMAKLAAELFNKMPDTFLKNALQNELSTRLNVSPQKLQQSASQTNTYSASDNKKKSTPIRSAITLLLQNPQLIGLIENFEVIKTIQQRGIPLLCELIQVLQHIPTMTTGALLEHWRDSSHYAALVKLATVEHLIPAEGLEAEFNGIIKQIQQLAIDQQVDKLMEKGKSEELSDVERKLLQTLLRLKNSIK
jgi:DNA primase